MSNKQTPAFAKLKDFERAFDVVDQIAVEQDIPSLTRPSQAKAAGEVVTLPAAASSLAEAQAAESKLQGSTSAPRPSKAAKPKKPPIENDDISDGVRRLTIDLPSYLFKEISQRGFDQGASAKYVILQALQNDSFTIEPEDMKKDGRRVRKEARHAA